MVSGTWGERRRAARRVELRGRGLLACLLACLLGAACSAYDPKRLPDPTAADRPTSGSGAGNAGAGGRAGSSAQGGTRSAGGTGGTTSRPPVGTVDAATPFDAGDPTSDASTSTDASQPIVDAGCSTLDASDDCCEDDDAKLQPGQCGCGVADTDGDGDGVADCVDGCPADLAKTAPGICGCGRPDADGAGVTSCSGLVSALVHRYRFDGSGTTLTDSKGDQDGTVVNATLTDTGQLELAGGTSDDYADLPNGLISSLTDATFEVWLTWSGGAAWQRIFDFGNNSAAEGSQGTGATYLFLTPRNVTGSGTLRVAYTTNGSSNETRLSAAAALSSSGMHHVAVVFDDTGNQMRLYVDDAPQGMIAITGSLSAINDVNNWLGRSQYSSDPELAGSLHELRIYGAPLSDAQLALSFADGPDPAYLEP